MITFVCKRSFPEVYEQKTTILEFGLLVAFCANDFRKSYQRFRTWAFSSSHEEKKKYFAYCFDGRNVCSCVLEGIPLANITDVTSPYLLGIVFHNLPISFILGTFLLREKQYFFLVYYRIICIGISIRNGFGDYFNPNWQPYFLALVGGIFLHISSVIIFRKAIKSQNGLATFFLVIAGVGLALVNHFFMHSSLKI